MNKNYLSMDEELRKGDYLLSNNGEYKAVFQGDGNFVVYGWKPVWASNTAGINDAQRLIMQGDCNLVMYTPQKPVWASGQTRSKVKTCRLTLGNDGILLIDNDFDEVWKSTKKN
ncbi:B-type lectin plumieribetin-like [Clarias gariepinus]|uniref:B-type lectin plumieribetin-like n=1 Tax=Clarias gariepinus TaxID=13013 RepID=UPI00234CE6F9|nr:B-type lectin plumieribetin-like [Clarias gariepinus]